MKQFAALIILAFSPCLAAHADIWKWVDEDGNVHFGDMPAPKNAENAELVKYTPGTRPTSPSSKDQTSTSLGKEIDQDETPAEKREREDAQAYYCNQAKEIYRSYVDATRLYRSSENGRREYLSEQEASAALANAEASVAEWCD